ncbi:cytochrome c [Oricola cellulosilytica]|uniref:Cytochrome c n=1 Tax=Oricola cellulosilytica TaxID=1429082 RepID=A0A4R0P6U1_9HYPH|nr:cytochrome c [Oricola cellulosilytica]TCD12389.1 cytochrome c [Oricola cellulosilytica]
MGKGSWRWPAFAGTIGVLAAVAGAQAAGDAIVKERQEAMKAMAAAAKAAAGMFEGTRPYSGTALKEAAETVRVHSGAAMKAQFPEDALGPPSAAKADIATDREAFDRIADRLEELATALSAAADAAPNVLSDEMRMSNQPMLGGSLLGARMKKADEDPADLPAEHVFHLVLDTCTSCHSKYRQKQE